MFLISNEIIAAGSDKIIPSLYQKSDKKKVQQWVDSVYNKMTLDQRIGQLFMPIVNGDVKEANKNRMLSLIRNQHIGGLLFSKGTPENQASLTNTAQKAAAAPCGAAAVLCSAALADGGAWGGISLLQKGKSAAAGQPAAARAYRSASAATLTAEKMSR